MYVLPLLIFYLQDWIHYFNNFFKKAGYKYKEKFTGKTVVIVETPSYFKAVNKYLTRR